MGLENLSEHEPEAPQFEDPNPLEPRDVAGVDAVGTQILQVLDSPEQVSEVIPEQPEFPARCTTRTIRGTPQRIFLSNSMHHQGSGTIPEQPYHLLRVPV